MNASISPHTLELRLRRPPLRYLAREACPACRGDGRTRVDRGGCRCVYRAAFRTALARYRELENPDPRAARFEAAAIFRADFGLAAKRSLEAADHGLFEAVFLHGESQLRGGHSNYWHAIYRIQSRVGREIVRTAPYLAGLPSGAGRPD